jgi:ribosomal protein S3
LNQKDILLKDALSDSTEQNDSLLNPSAIGDNALHNVENEITKSKVLGFRIQAKGRRGARSSKQVVEYGKLSFGNVNSKIDFGQSSFTTKRGSTGVKVYVCYE